MTGPIDFIALRRNVEASLTAGTSKVSDQRRLYQAIELLQAATPSARDAFGQSRLPALLHYFVAPDRPSIIRRWVGLIVHELLRGSQLSRTLIGEHVPDLRPLIGRIILAEQDEALKVVAGQIIQALMLNGASPEQFWPDNVLASQIAAGFPTRANRQWLEEFQEFTDKLHDQKLVREGDVDIVYARGLAVANSSQITPVGTILVIIHRVLTCVVPAGTGDRFQYLDIPLENLQAAEVRSSTVSSENSVAGGFTEQELRLRLRSQKWTFLLDAQPKEYETLSLYFDSESTLREALAGINTQKKKLTSQARVAATFKVSTSQALDVSKQQHPSTTNDAGIESQAAADRCMNESTDEFRNCTSGREPAANRVSNYNDLYDLSPNGKASQGRLRSRAKSEHMLSSSFSEVPEPRTALAQATSSDSMNFAAQEKQTPDLQDSLTASDVQNLPQKRLRFQNPTENGKITGPADKHSPDQETDTRTLSLDEADYDERSDVEPSSTSAEVWQNIETAQLKQVNPKEGKPYLVASPGHCQLVSEPCPSKGREKFSEPSHSRKRVHPRSKEKPIPGSENIVQPPLPRSRKLKDRLQEEIGRPPKIAEPLMAPPPKRLHKTSRGKMPAKSKPSPKAKARPTRVGQKQETTSPDNEDISIYNMPETPPDTVFSKKKTKKAKVVHEGKGSLYLADSTFKSLNKRVETSAKVSTKAKVEDFENPHATFTASTNKITRQKGAKIGQSCDAHPNDENEDAPRKRRKFHQSGNEARELIIVSEESLNGNAGLLYSDNLNLEATGLSEGRETGHSKEHAIGISSEASEDLSEGAPGKELHPSIEKASDRPEDGDSFMIQGINSTREPYSDRQFAETGLKLDAESTLAFNMDEHATRKTPIISFGPDGPRNQGRAQQLRHADLNSAPEKRMDVEQFHVEQSMVRDDKTTEAVLGSEARIARSQELTPSHSSYGPGLPLESPSPRPNDRLSPRKPLQDVSNQVVGPHGPRENRKRSLEDDVDVTRSEKRVKLVSPGSARVKIPNQAATPTLNTLNKPRVRAWIDDFGSPIPLVAISNQYTFTSGRAEQSCQRNHAEHRPFETADRTVHPREMQSVSPDWGHLTDVPSTPCILKWSERVPSRPALNAPQSVSETALNESHNVPSASTAGKAGPVKKLPILYYGPNPFQPRIKTRIEQNAFLTRLRSRPTRTEDQRRSSWRQKLRKDLIMTPLKRTNNTAINFHSPYPQCAESESSSEGDDRYSTAEENMVDGVREEMEWEASLKPHQKDLISVLSRLSKRLIRTLICSEDAVTDIITDYKENGAELIRHLEKRFEAETQKCLDQLRRAKKDVSDELKQTVKKLEQEAEEVRPGSSMDRRQAHAEAMQGLLSRIEQDINANSLQANSC